MSSRLKPELRTEPLPQQFHEPRILLNRQDFAGVLQKQFRQRPQSRPDFEDFVRLRQFSGLDDAPELIRVVQKFLAEGFGKLNPACHQ